MTSGSHLWSWGIKYLTGTVATTTQANWLSIYSGVAPFNTWSGHWRLTLLTAVGSYTSGQYYNAAGQSEVGGGTGYTALGVQIDQTANTVAFGSGNAPVEYLSVGSTKSNGVSSWTSSTFTANYAQVIMSTGTASTTAVLGQFDFGQAYTVTSGTFSVTFGTDAGQSNSVFNIAPQ